MLRLQLAYLFITWVLVVKISDSELIMLIREKNEEAEAILNERYTDVIKKIISHYYTELRKLNINIEELITSCQEVFNKALEQYNSLSKASFKTYANLIISRKIKKTILKVLRNNKKTLENKSFDLDDIEKYHINNSLDPLNEMCMKENNNLLIKMIVETLSNKELDVFSLLIDGKDCHEIASILNKNYSQVYRNIQNIKRKLAPELEKFAN